MGRIIFKNKMYKNMFKSDPVKTKSIAGKSEEATFLKPRGNHWLWREKKLDFWRENACLSWN